jgi:hypothetical protein
MTTGETTRTMLTEPIPEPHAWRGPVLVRARLMSAARTMLDDGPGVVVLDRLPLERMSRAEAIDLYWLLASMLEPPVAPEWKGTDIYDVPVRRMDDFLTDPGNRLELWLEPGQIQFLNNRVVVHGRTAYEDHDEPERRRHLVRLWVRAGDRRQFRG